MNNDIVILGEGTWLPVAMTAALAAAMALYARHPSALPPRQLITAMMNLFAGVTLAIMGGGHLLVGTAVVVNAFLLIGGLVFMVSGQTFEQFSGTE